MRDAGDGSREAAILVDGMRCTACAWLVEQVAARVPGVSFAQAHFASRRTLVRWDPAVAKLSAVLAAIRAVGYPAWPFEAQRLAQVEARERRAMLRRLWVAGLGMMQVMMYAVPGYIAGSGEIAPDIARLMDWAALVLTLPVLGYSAGPFFAGAWRSLRHRSLGMDVPVALGIGTAFAASAVATWRGSGAVYFDSVTMFVFLLTAGRYLELLARDARRAHAAAAGPPGAAGRAAAARRLRAGRGSDSGGAPESRRARAGARGRGASRGRRAGERRGVAQRGAPHRREPRAAARTRGGPARRIGQRGQRARDARDTGRRRGHARRHRAADGTRPRGAAAVGRDGATRLRHLRGRRPRVRARRGARVAHDRSVARAVGRGLRPHRDVPLRAFARHARRDDGRARRARAHRPRGEPRPRHRSARRRDRHRVRQDRHAHGRAAARARGAAAGQPVRR